MPADEQLVTLRRKHHAPEQAQTFDKPLMPRGLACVIYTGCMRRGTDKDVYEVFLEANGWQITRRHEEADLLLFDTCGVTNDRTVASMNYLDELRLTLKPDARVIVCGCATKTAPGIVARRFEGETFGPREQHLLDAMLGAEVSIETFEHPFELGAPGDDFDPSRYFFENFDSSTVQLKVARGCLSACAFCAIRHATGLLASRAPAELEQQLREGLATGFTKVCLIGEDVAAYGLDIHTDISSLIERLLTIDAPYAMGLFDMNPRWVIEQFDRLEPLLLDPRVREILLPVQSGSDRILDAMRRQHSASDQLRVVERITSRRPDVLLGASVIAGFPGETEDDFARTMDLLKHFTYASVSAFSPVLGTPAADMPDQVPRKLRIERAQRARAVTHARVFS